MIIGFDASRSFNSQRTGTENYSYELLRHLLSIDSENTYRVYLRNGMGKDDLILQSKNVKIVDIRMPRLWTQFGLAKEVLLHQPDILFIPAHTLPVIHRPGLKSVVSIHDLGAEFLPQYHQFPQKLYLNRSTEYAVKHATKLIAVSQATKEDLVRRLGANSEKISVVYEGYDRERFHQIGQTVIDRIRQQYKLTKPYFLFVGTIQPRKNLVRLITAFSVAVKERELSDFELIMVGKKGWLSDEIYQAPAKFNIENRVRFIDYVDSADLPAIYAGAHVFVFPSLFEGFGLPVLEAMACGVPVLTSDISSMPEVAGNAAVLVDPTDINAIAEGLIKIATNETIRASVRTAGQSQLQKFSWEKTAQETLAVFEQVAKGGAFAKSFGDPKEKI